MDATSERDDALTAVERAPRYGTIIVVGGGCYGSYDVRQLRRAAEARRIAYEQVLVVDRDPSCRVAIERTADVEVAEWESFFARYLATSDADTRDAIVPSPLMPHLMYRWLRDRADARWPGREVATRDAAPELDTPWNSAAPEGTRYASFATWTCPVNCIEPARCPHTRGDRTWTMPEAARAAVAASVARGEGMAGPVIFHCTHRAFGVGMFDVRDVLAADRFVADAASAGPADILVGTVSHCHGAFNVLHVGADPS